MRNTITIWRWRIDLYGNAIYLQTGPKPGCKDCHGIGRTDAEAQGSDTETSHIEICDCWNPWGSRRIPIWFRRTERYPF
jgi:hypothetical protein